VRAPRDYIAEPLHVYMTMTNMRGTPWRVQFDGGYYHMISHGDRMHCAIRGAGSWATDTAVSQFGKDDAPRYIDAAAVTVRTQEWINSPEWHDFAMGALASSAFPVGLAPRTIFLDLKADYPRLFPSADLVHQKITPTPNWSDAITAKATFVFGSADGGVIDNDPFEYAHFAVKDAKNLEGRNDRNVATATRAIMMITPFPEEKPIAPEGSPKVDIISFVSALFPSLIDQARFKPDALAIAANPDYGSRFLISPSRVVGTRNFPYGIASGLLGGFGGFISGRFRDHDFRLGRRNCQQFLRTSFVAPENHRIFGNWVKAAGPEFVAKQVQNPDKSETKFYPLIPLYGDAAHDVDACDWPRLTQTEFEELMTAIAARFDYVAPKLLDAQNLNSVLKGVLKLSLSPVLNTLSPNLTRGATLHIARYAVLSELVRRDQIEGWSLAGVDLHGLSEEDARLVLGALLGEDVETMTAIEIEAAIGHAVFKKATTEQIGALLEGLTAVQGNLSVVARGEGEGRNFRLAMRMGLWDKAKGLFCDLRAKIGV